MTKTFSQLLGSLMLEVDAQHDSLWFAVRTASTGRRFRANPSGDHAIAVTMLSLCSSPIDMYFEERGSRSGHSSTVKLLALNMMRNHA